MPKRLELTPSELRRVCNPSQFDFKDTSELTPLDVWSVGHRLLDPLREQWKQESSLKAGIAGLIPKSRRASAYGVFHAAFGVVALLHEREHCQRHASKPRFEPVEGAGRKAEDPIERVEPELVAALSRRHREGQKRRSQPARRTHRAHRRQIGR